MGKVISMRLSDAEEARVRGAAALVGLSTSAYLKWLLINGKNGDQNHNELVLRRLDEIGVAIGRLSAGSSRQPAPIKLSVSPDRATIVRRLKDRGVPSSTIRQLEAVLDEVPQSRAESGGLHL